MDDDRAQRLLSASELVGKKRWAVADGQAFCALETRPGVWHGYPVDWVEVPASITQKWIRAGKVSRRTVHRNWKEQR